MASLNYGCAQSELYTVCRNAWLLCQQYLTAFVAYKSKYSAAWINENLSLIMTAEAMEDHEARTAPVKDLRNNLADEKIEIAAFYKQLKGYLMDTYGNNKTTLDAVYTEMGQAYYDKMSNGSWTEVDGLMSAMIPFVRKNAEALKEKGFMPTDFLTRLEAAQLRFKAAYEAWKNGSAAISPATEAKIIANNELKTRVMAMLTDGQAVFAKDKATAQKFVWSTLLAKERGNRPTSLGGKVTDMGSKAPLSIATANIPSLGLTANCDESGRYEFPTITEGIYTIEFIAEGYQKLVVEDKEVKAGIKGRLSVAMEAIGVLVPV